MIPAGYMLKTVAKPPGFVTSAEIVDLYSLSECVSTPFIDAFETWKHNGYWLYDSVDTIRNIVGNQGIAIDDPVLFYYELNDEAFDADLKLWTPALPDPAWPVAVEPPASKTLQGFDVTTHFMGVRPECSPLACNNLAAEVPVNTHGLFTTAEDARAALEAGRFDDCEEGPYRIFAVYTVEDDFPTLRTPGADPVHAG